MRVLSRSEVERLLRPADVVPVMADAMRRYSAGSVDQPLRTILRPAGHTSLLGTMPCHVDGPGLGEAADRDGVARGILEQATRAVASLEDIDWAALDADVVAKLEPL